MNVFKLKVHPAADIFPMLTEDELEELAADIKAHGLLHPIILKDGQLIDGRNRLEACRRAGVEPQVEDLNGLDPVAYIMSANINRRNLTKGQRAMAVAKLYPDPATLKRKGSVKNTELVSTEYVSHARTVLRWVPELADLVMAGTKPLNEAYAEAQRLKEQADAEPQRLARLRGRASDLADLVDEGRMTLIEAESAYLTRQEDHRRQRQAVLDTLDGLERLLDMFAEGKRRAHVVEYLQQPDDHRRAKGLLTQWAHNIAATLEALK
jgi:ParB-like nuclease domain